MVVHLLDVPQVQLGSHLQRSPFRLLVFLGKQICIPHFSCEENSKEGTYMVEGTFWFSEKSVKLKAVHSKDRTEEEEEDQKKGTLHPSDAH